MANDEAGEGVVERKNPVFLRLLKGVWRVLRTVFLLIFGRVGLTIMLLLLLGDYLLESKGISGKFLDMALHTQESGMLVKCRWIHLGIFKGIMLHDVDFDMNTKAGPVVVHARRASAQMNWSKIFNELGWVPNAVKVSGVTFNLMGGGGGSVMSCEVREGTLEFAGDNQLQLNVKGESQGIKLELDGIFTNARDFLAMYKGDDSPVTPDPELTAMLERIGGKIRSFGRLSDDSSINVSLRANCMDWLSGSMTCRFNLSDWLVNGVVVSKCRGHFKGNLQEISIDGLDVVLSRSETIGGSGKFYPQSKEIEAEIEGSMAPATICQLAGIDTRDWLTHRVRIPSLKFSGRLPKCTMDISKMSPSLDCELTSSFEVFGVDIEHGSLKLSYKDKKVSADDVSFVLTTDEQEWLKGRMSLDLDNMQVEGSIHAKLIWLERLKKYGVHLPEGILAGGDDSADIDMTLKSSPLDWRQMKLSGRLEDHDLRFLTQSCRQLGVAFEFDNGKFSIKPLQIDLRQAKDAVKLNVFCDVAGGLSKKVLKAEFDLNVLARPDMRDEPQCGLSCNGTVEYDLEGRRIGLSSCSGECHPDWLYQSYCRRLNLSMSYVFVLLGTGSRPVAFNLELPLISLESLDKWKMLAKVKGYDSHFGTFKVKEIGCDVKVDSSEVDITNIKATTLADEKLRLDIRVQYSPLEFSIKNLELNGNPALAEAFILNSEAQSVYRQIWSEVKWDAKNKPMVRMPTLIYKEGAPWSLTLTAHINAENVSYHGYTSEELNLIVSLALPSSLSIKPISLKTQEGDVYGEIAITFGGTPQCTFKIDGEEGYLNPKTLLTTVNRDFANHLADITFSDKSRLSLEGEMFLNGDSRISVNGSLHCPKMTWRDHELTDIESTWSYSMNGVAWNVTKSTYLEGTLRTSGVYEPANNRGEFLALVDGVPFSRVTRMFGKSDDELRNKPKPGWVSGEAHGRFLCGWAGRPLHLEGDGHIAIREADMWNDIPLLAQLGELLPGGKKSKAALGNITQLDADIEFLGTHLVIPQLYTDGTIMALRGKGEYGLENGKFKLQMSGVPLQEVGILSLALSPLTWAFQAELDETQKWRMKSGLMQLFSGPER